MKLILLTLAAASLLLLLLAAPPASADINQFAGRWKNVDPDTGGLTTLRIAVRGRRLRVEAWGRCHPSDCAWGYAEATVYAPGVTADPAEAAQVATTLYVTSFSQTILVIRPMEGGRLRVETFTKFTDESARADYTTVQTFSRAVGEGAGE